MKYLSISSGKKVEIQKINYYKVFAISRAVEDEMRAEGWQVDKPTYEVKVGTGEDTQPFEHRHELDGDGNVIDSTLETDSDFEAWQKYEDAQSEKTRRYGIRVAKFALLNGIKVDMDDGWEEEQEYFGIKVPEDKRDKYLHYINTEVFPDVRERSEIAIQIVNMSAPDIEDTATQEAVQEFFRGALEAEQGP